MLLYHQIALFVQFSLADRAVSACLEFLDCKKNSICDKTSDIYSYLLKLIVLYALTVAVRRGFIYPAPF